MQALPQIPLPNFPIWLFVKILFIIGLLVYLVFSVVVIQQTKIMTETVKLEFESAIKLLALIHFLFALGILIFAVIVL